MKKFYAIIAHCALITTSMAYSMDTKEEDSDWVFINNGLEKQATRKRVTAMELRKILLEKEDEIMQLTNKCNNELQEKIILSQEIADLKDQLTSLKQVNDQIALDYESKTQEVIRLSSVAQMAQTFQDTKMQNQSKPSTKKNSILTLLARCLPSISTSQSNQDFVTLQEEKKQ